MSSKANQQVKVSRLRKGARRIFRGWLLVLALVTVVVVLIIGALFFAGRDRPSVPSINTAGLEPAVANLILSACQEVAATPSSADSWGKLGTVLMHYEFVPEASTAFQRAETLAPTVARWPYLHALLWLPRDRAAALVLLRRASASDVSAEAPRLQLAQLLLEQGNGVAAAREYQEILQRAPGHARALLGLARVARAAARWEECRRYLTPCLQDARTTRAAYALLAQVQQVAGETAAAAESARRSVTLPEDLPAADPDWAAALQWRVDRKARLAQASSLIEQGRFADALTRLQAIAGQFPDDDEVYYHLGWVFNHLERYSEAEETLREQLRRTPQSAKALAQLGVTLLSRKNHGEAVKVLEAGVQLKPTSRELQSNLGYAYWQLGRTDDAVAHLHAAQRLDPSYVPTYTALAEAYERRGETNLARAALQQALAIDPSNQRALLMFRQIGSDDAGTPASPPLLK